jgi:hypothetical protein
LFDYHAAKEVRKKLWGDLSRPIFYCMKSGFVRKGQLLLTCTLIALGLAISFFGRVIVSTPAS